MERLVDKLYSQSAEVGSNFNNQLFVIQKMPNTSWLLTAFAQFHLTLYLMSLGFGLTQKSIIQIERSLNNENNC